MWKAVTTSRVGKSSNIRSGPTAYGFPSTPRNGLYGTRMLVRALAYFRMIPGTGERERDPILSEGPTTPPHE
jgi:hypothetical protein